MPRISVAERRRDLIAAAIEVIATHGIDGATTRRITDQAKANIAMMHYCYDSKEDLFSDVFAFVAARYREVVEASDPHTTIEDAAVQILRGVMQCYVDSREFAAATFELVSWGRRQHEDRGIAVYDQAIDSVREALRQAQSDEPVGPEAIDEIVYVVATLSDGFGLNWLTYDDVDAARQQMDLNCSVLEAWMTTRLAAARTSPPRRRRRAAAAR